MVIGIEVGSSGNFSGKLQFKPGDHYIRGMHAPSVEATPSLCNNLVQCQFNVIERLVLCRKFTISQCKGDDILTEQGLKADRVFLSIIPAIAFARKRRRCAG
ncbi:hypothetical protein HGG76_25620 [Ochrobactrum tritici]|uniref:Uncharacterized protein n=1 Tax=Brucella tritici TaxID=94626 RepID=A0A7X6JBN9_9HYPH|nr:hypothetical protein [Brucella tritici]